MRGTTAKKLRKAAEVWMKMDSRVTNFRQAYQTLKKHYKEKKSGG